MIDVNAILQMLLTIILVPLVAFGIEYLRRRIGIEKIQRIKQEFEAKQDWALIAVRFAEQVYKTQNGATKYNAACEWLSTHAEAKGVGLSILEIEGLIESSVQILKSEIPGLWTPVTNVVELSGQSAPT